MNKVILYQIYKKCKLIVILLKAAQWYLLITRKHTIKTSVLFQSRADVEAF